MGWLSSIREDMRTAQRRDPATVSVSSVLPRATVVGGDRHLAGVSWESEQPGIPTHEIGRRR